MKITLFPPGVPRASTAVLERMVATQPAGSKRRRGAIKSPSNAHRIDSQNASHPQRACNERTSSSVTVSDHHGQLTTVRDNDDRAQEERSSFSRRKRPGGAGRRAAVLAGGVTPL